MALNNYLTGLASVFHIAYGSNERSKIQTTANAVVTALQNYFGTDVVEVKIFGSHTRNTILPRNFDPKSDIDILVRFNHERLGLTPETYRNRLKRFASATYPRSTVSKDFPSITIELNHVKLDLVPCIYQNSFWGGGNLYIPDSNGDWQPTDPDGFTNELTEVNQRFNQIVKPIIRLMKAWNSKAGCPYDSFDLEQQIAKMNFRGDNVESGFYYAIDNLDTYGLSYANTQKVTTLRNNKQWVEEYIRRGDVVRAKQWLHKILPN